MGAQAIFNRELLTVINRSRDRFTCLSKKFSLTLRVFVITVSHIAVDYVQSNTASSPSDTVFSSSTTISVALTGAFETRSVSQDVIKLRCIQVNISFWRAEVVFANYINQLVIHPLRCVLIIYCFSFITVIHK